jgi:hypothetical protein
VKVSNPSADLLSIFKEIEKVALDNLNSQKDSVSESLYKAQLGLLLDSEDKLPSDEKHHKGDPLHNLGV